jgi:hypothetical protein
MDFSECSRCVNRSTGAAGRVLSSAAPPSVGLLRIDGK